MTETPTLKRLEDQIAWYDGRSKYNQRMFKAMKIAEVVAGALVPLAAGMEAPPLVTGALGALIVVLETLQHLNQYHENWIRYRSTAEALKHEKYLYLASAGPYVQGDSLKLLAERLEGLVSQEHARWVAGRERAVRRTEGTGRE